MTNSELKKLLMMNAGIWFVVAVSSFVLPFVVDSALEGRGAFLKVLLHIGLLAAGMLFSNAAIRKALGTTTAG